MIEFLDGYFLRIFAVVEPWHAGQEGSLMVVSEKGQIDTGFTDTNWMTSEMSLVGLSKEQVSACRRAIFIRESFV